MNLLARRQENLPAAPGLRSFSADELFKRILRTWMQDDPFQESCCSGQEFEVGEKEITLSLPCPGRKAEEIDVEIMGDLLTVKSCFCDKKEQKEPKERSCVFSERCTSMCVGSFRIPVKVIGKDAKAHCQDGVLTITIPRDLTKAEPQKSIKIICE